MSRLSEFLRKNGIKAKIPMPEFKININIPFGGRRKEKKRPVGRPPKEIKMDKPWYKSKAKVGVLVFTIVNIIEHTLPEFGINIPIPGAVHNLLDYFFGGLGAWGVRDAIK